jgi:hypothetical protein
MGGVYPEGEGRMKGIQGMLQLEVDRKHDDMITLVDWIEGQKLDVLVELRRRLEVEICYRMRGKEMEE